MKISKIRINKINSNGEEDKLRGICSFVIDDYICITGVKIMEGSKGLFVAMPSRKTTNGEYKDIVFPVTSEARETIQNAILKDLIKS